MTNGFGRLTIVCVCVGVCWCVCWCVVCVCVCLFSDKLEKKTTDVDDPSKEVSNPYYHGGQAALVLISFSIIFAIVGAALAILQVAGVQIPGLSGSLDGLVILGASAGATATMILAWILYAGIVYSSKNYKKGIPQVDLKVHASYSFFFVFISSLVLAGASFIAFLAKGSADTYREI